MRPAAPNRRPRTASCLAGSVAVVVFVTLLGAGDASARTSAARIQAVPRVGPPTTNASLGGSGFGSSEVVDLLFDGSRLATATTDRSGAFTGHLCVPLSATPGQHLVAARGESSHLLAEGEFLVWTDWTKFHLTSPTRETTPTRP